MISSPDVEWRLASAYLDDQIARAYDDLDAAMPDSRMAECAASRRANAKVLRREARELDTRPRLQWKTLTPQRHAS